MRIFLALVLLALTACSSPSAPVSRSPHSSESDGSSETVAEDSCEGETRSFVDVAFDLTAAGEVENARIVRACPPGKFEEQVLQTVSGWKYQATGAPRRNLQIRMQIPEGAK